MATTIIELSPDLREWVDAGLIRPDQAEAIARHRIRQHDDAVLADGAARHDRRVPLLAEALGYLGAALVAVAGAVLLVGFWDEMPYGVRLILAAALTLALLGVGAMLRDAPSPAAQRLAGFAWAVGVGGAAWVAALVAGRDGLALEDAALATAVSLTAGAVALTLWRLRARWQQHVVAFVAIQASAVSLVSLAADPVPIFYGLTVAGLGLVWLALAEVAVIAPVSVGRWLGLIGLLAGMRLAPSDNYVGAGLLLGLAVTVALLGSGVLTERPLYLGFGAAAIFLFVPHAVFHFFGDTIGAPAALLLIGLTLLSVALIVMRSRHGNGLTGD